MDRIEPEWPAIIDVRSGWYPLLAQLDARLAALAPDYVVQQVKSKFGALCFYARPAADPSVYDEEFNETIRATEWESTSTCEECGASAKQYTIRLWVWTLCDDHLQAKLTG
ncbi:hypothetical protein [Microbacterium sp. 22242]|uniref:hypothetical protein n=1 Tax=Microbacterium sp. 22242 TaxID=3453896 RepID=UPI003F8799B3